ncbi:hypothetical protein [Paraburkholderia dilworthii]|uniref:hypothetical protein n=1 Tax=Paraburkholderia dilworthii TaxID=948106 RepID=UPI0012683944|nr:hypothetical protein [Paraburkholderia dilworthii]
MTTITTAILIISAWVIVVLLLCSLVRNGAIREREEHERLTAAAHKKDYTVAEWRYGSTQTQASIASHDADHGQAELPEVGGPPGQKTMP